MSRLGPIPHLGAFDQSAYSPDIDPIQAMMDRRELFSSVYKPGLYEDQPNMGARVSRSFAAQPFARVETAPQDMPGKLEAMMDSGNALFLASKAISDWAERAFAGGETRGFRPHDVIGAFENQNLTSNEKNFLLKSSSAREFDARWRQVFRERQANEVLAGMTFGESLGYGLVAGITDPTSYIPFFGQANRVKNVHQLYRHTTNLVARGGHGIKAARLTLLRNTNVGFRRGFWHGAAEGAAYELAFQNALIASSINKDQASEGMLPSIAMTAAFSGLLTGAGGAVTRRTASRQIQARATARINPDYTPVMRAAAEGLDALEPGKMGRGSGARARVNAAREVVQSKTSSKKTVTRLLIRVGVAADEAEADRLAEKILSDVDGWTAPLRMDGTVRAINPESVLAKAMVGETGRGVRASALEESGYVEVDGQLINVEGEMARQQAFQTVDRSTEDSPQTKYYRQLEAIQEYEQAEAARQAARKAAGEPDEESNLTSYYRGLESGDEIPPEVLDRLEKKAKKQKAGRISALKKKLKAENKKTGKDRNFAEVLRLKKQIRELEEAPFEFTPKQILDESRRLLRELEQELEPANIVRDAAARAINNPRPHADTPTPKQLADDGIGTKQAAKIAEVDGETKAAKFMQMLADVKAGTFAMADFIRFKFGRGMVPFMDGQVTQVKVPGLFGRKSSVMTVRVEVVDFLDERIGDLYGKFIPAGGGKPARILINMDKIISEWDDLKNSKDFVLTKNLSVFSDLTKLDPKKDINTVKLGNFFNTPEEYADFILLHEMAHQYLWGRSQRKMNKLFKDLGREGYSDPDPKTGGWSDAKFLIEAQTNSMVMAWKKHADDLAEEGGAHVSEGFGFGPQPRGSSIPTTNAEGPTHGLVADYMAKGWSRVKATRIAQWLRTTSPLARASTSPSLIFRTVIRHLTESPMYLIGSPVEGGAASMKVKYRYEQPTYRIYEKQEKLWKDISDGEGAKLAWDEYDARVHRAIATGSDNVNDKFTSAVNEIANDYAKFNRKLEMEGQGIGWIGRQVFPEGERYYRRVYNMQAVESPAFIKMLMGRGLSEEDAVAIRDSIRSNFGVPSDEFSVATALRGALRKRNSALAEIPYDDLAPFLDRSAFKTQLNAAKAMGGEIELRSGVLNAVRELNSHGVTNIKVEDILERKSFVDELTGESEDVILFNLDPLVKAIDEEFASMKDSGGLIVNEENMSLAWKRDWGKGSDLAEKYPEHAEYFREFAENPVTATFATREQIAKEDAFAHKFLGQVVQTLQHRRDIEANPDSWLEARLPSFIKNATHAILGGFVGVANLADFHRSIAEFGFKRAFGSEWGLLIKDIEAWSARAKATEDMNLALEHVFAGVDRSLRNMSEHITPKTKAEKFVESAASWMSRLNGMDRITNAHQKMFSSTAQGFILDNLDDFLLDNLTKKDVLRMEKMGLGPSQARKIKDWLESGAMKTSKGGTKYADMSVDGPGRELYLAAVQKAVYTMQSVPSRDEMFDVQVQSWGGVITMYKNWVTAANNRVVGSALSNPDAALMSGLAASVGLGALVTTVRWMLGGREGEKPWENPDQFLRDALLSGGYLGLAGEAGNLIARATNDKIDPLILGEGNRGRFHNSDTVMSAFGGPAWHYPSFVNNTFNDTVLDRHDWNRIWGMVPFNNLFYVDGLWNLLNGS